MYLLLTVISIRHFLGGVFSPIMPEELNSLKFPAKSRVGCYNWEQLKQLICD